MEQKRTAWEALLEMEQYSHNVVDMDQGAVTLAVEMVKVFEKERLKVVWTWAMHFGFPQRFRVLRGYFQRRMCSGSFTNHHSNSSRLELVSLAIENCDAVRNG